MIRQADHSGRDNTSLQTLWDTTSGLITWYAGGSGTGLCWQDYEIHISEDAQGPQLALATIYAPLRVTIGGVSIDVTHRIETFIGPRDSVKTLRGAASFLLALREILRAWLPTLPPGSVVYGLPPENWPHKTYFLSGTTPRAEMLPLGDSRILIYQTADILLKRA